MLLNKAITQRKSLNISLRTAAVNFSTEGKGSPKLWGGRFTKDTNVNILKWIESISTD